MANKTTANAFMASAQKSKREMADIQKEGSGKHETDEVELKKISLLIPAWLHKEAQLHRVETGESTAVILSPTLTPTTITDPVSALRLAPTLSRLLRLPAPDGAAARSLPLPRRQ